MWAHLVSHVCCSWPQVPPECVALAARCAGPELLDRSGWATRDGAAPGSCGSERDAYTQHRFEVKATSSSSCCSPPTTSTIVNRCRLDMLVRVHSNELVVRVLNTKYTVLQPVLSGLSVTNDLREHKLNHWEGHLVIRMTPGKYLWHDCVSYTLEFVNR